MIPKSLGISSPTAPGRPDLDQGKGEHGAGQLGADFSKLTYS
jgi:hypothetical protein